MAPPQGRPGGSGSAEEPAEAALETKAATAAGRAAAAFVGALSKAARSFTLYDPSNAVVKGFLADYRAAAAAATAEGALVLLVRPFQLVRAGEVVYEEADRERSLSFRLFRDGLRRLSFEPGVPWEELLRLLEILAIRSTGVRQQEDDSVTLLRKAELQAIGFEAVEGFVPEEESPEPVEASRVSAEASAPQGFDTPFPRLPPPAELSHEPIPEEALAALREEERPESFGRVALGVAAALLREVARKGLPAADARRFLVEARDYFVADGSFGALAGLADLATRLPGGALRDEILRSLGDVRILDLILASHGETRELPPAVARLLPLVPAEGVLDLLASEKRPARKAVLLRMAEARVPAETGAIVARLGGLDAATAGALVRAISARDPAKTAAALEALLEHPEDGPRIFALEALAAHPGEIEAQKAFPLLRADAEAVRIAAARLLERRGEADAFDPLQEQLTRRRGTSRAEADALARALATVHPVRAGPVLGEWARARRGVLRRALGSGDREELLRWAAVTGLGALPGADAARRIEEVAEHADEELRRHCRAVLARRRKEAAGRG